MPDKTTRVLTLLVCILSTSTCGCWHHGYGELSRHSNVRLSWGSKIVYYGDRSANIRGEGTTLAVFELTPEDKASILNLPQPLPGIGWSRSASAQRVFKGMWTMGLDREQIRKLRGEEAGSYATDQPDGRDCITLYLPDASNLLYFYWHNM